MLAQRAPAGRQAEPERTCGRKFKSRLEQSSNYTKAAEFQFKPSLTPPIQRILPALSTQRHAYVTPLKRALKTMKQFKAEKKQNRTVTTPGEKGGGKSQEARTTFAPRNESVNQMSTHESRWWISSQEKKATRNHLNAAGGERRATKHAARTPACRKGLPRERTNRPQQLRQYEIQKFDPTLTYFQPGMFRRAQQTKQLPPPQQYYRSKSRLWKHAQLH